MATTTATRIRRAPLSAAERRHLWWGVPPLAVLTLAHLVFDVSGGGYATLGRELVGAADAATGADRTAVVVAATLGWAGLAMAYLVVSAGTAVAALRILRGRVRGRASRPLLVFVAVVVVAGLGHLLVVDRFDLPLHGIFAVTLEALQREPLVGASEVTAIRVTVALINILSVLVPALFLAAAVATTLPPLAGWTEATLARRARQIRQVVGLAAVFMVVGVLHMGSWTQLAGATLTAEADQALDLAAVAVTLFWGAAFTLMIASFYLPMGMRLSELAEGVMDDLGVGGAERRSWLVARGLSFEPSHQLPQIAAVVAPLLAGPIGGTITSAAERVAGY